MDLATIAELQKLIDERNWRLGMIAKYAKEMQLDPKSGVGIWYLHYSTNEIIKIDERILAIRSTLHREHQSVLEALGVQ